MLYRIDGKVQSALVGGDDIWDVYKRNDEWYCILYEYVLFFFLKENPEKVLISEQ